MNETFIFQILFLSYNKNKTICAPNVCPAMSGIEIIAKTDSDQSRPDQQHQLCSNNNNNSSEIIHNGFKEDQPAPGKPEKLFEFNVEY